MNETTEFAILHDNYKPTEKEVVEMAQKLFDLEVKVNEKKIYKEISRKQIRKNQ